MPYEIRELSKNEFPASLLQIPQQPKKLFLAGELPSEDSIFLAVVGSRKHTSYGADACEKIIEGLAGYPIVIVSGLALGIDALAHRAAIRAGLKTLAVPGSGIHPKAIYPRTNLSLAEEIVGTGGALLSEYEPDFRATTWSFPARNRIMAGLSRAVLVIEADERSGTLITARLATEYDRDVYVIPNGIFSPGSRGSNKLLKQGAYPITDAADIPLLLGLKNDNVPFQERLPFDLSPEEQTIFTLLAEPMPRDDLIRASGVPTSNANTLLSVMEIKGIIVERGGVFRRI
ncbi:MAG: DNA-processing protein DprA [Candidatus Pacebacteria bacterium]|jgi:DNA processing protein|nr:DNA-processing protein DprA [Candidatus Paceibacterota bacterium]